VAFHAFIADSLGAVQVSNARPEYSDGAGLDVDVVEVVAALAVSAPPMSTAAPAADHAAYRRRFEIR
jgi:hypothetical protein